MHVASKLVTALLAISLIGSWSVHADQCEATTTLCRSTQSQLVNCCQAMHCHCDLSGPVHSAPNPMRNRANTTAGNEIVKVASLPVDAMFFAGREYLNLRSSARSNTSLSSAASSYLLTHAFLI
jgi:hypothetical protein